MWGRGLGASAPFIRYEIFIRVGYVDLGSGERNLFATKDVKQRTWILLRLTKTGKPINFLDSLSFGRGMIIVNNSF